MRAPSHQTVAAYAALFIALGGGAYAASLPRNSVGTPQLKKNAVTSAKVKNGSLKAADFAKGQLPVGTKGDTGPQGLNGDPGANGAPGTPGTPGTAGADGSAVAFAHVRQAGTLDAANSKNVTATIKHSVGEGLYCVQTSVPVKNGVATADIDGSPPEIIGLTMVPAAVQDVCKNELPGANVLVTLHDHANANVSQTFYVAFN
ncbi:MAG TPA: collagen-like protein [Thermoleophilaceae bacterium]